MDQRSARRGFWRLIQGLVVLGLVGCATTPPSSFYRLSPVVIANDQGPLQGGDIGVGLGPVTFPVFLDRPEIVSRKTENALKLSEFDRWGGTLQDDFLRVWSENLASLLGSGRILIFPSEIRYPLDVRVAADILAFEGAADGRAILKVRWVVMDQHLQQPLAVREDHYSRPISAPGDTNALVAALSLTLADFSQDVASLIRTLPRSSQAEIPVR